MVKNLIRKSICWVIGHRYQCLHFHVWGRDRNIGGSASTSSGWECQCCGKTKSEQWDE